MAGEIERFSLGSRVARLVNLQVLRMSWLPCRMKESCTYGISDLLPCLLQNRPKWRMVL